MSSPLPGPGNLSGGEFPRFDERRCTACGDCLRVCPTSCLAIVHQVPVISAMRACISCGVCQTVCPAGAVSLIAPRW